MIERRDMTVDDFLALMERNIEHYPEFANMDEEKKLFLAEFNIQIGTAQSYFIDGQLIACGGIRAVGIGEAWLVASPEMLKEHKKTLFRETKLEVEDAHRQGFWCILADAKISGNFLEHLGFKKKTVYVKVRI